MDLLGVICWPNCLLTLGDTLLAGSLPVGISLTFVNDMITFTEALSLVD